jgi:hypothetical protein
MTNGDRVLSNCLSIVIGAALGVLLGLYLRSG